MGLLVIALIGLGAYEVTRLPIDAVPDITDNQVQVITVTPALGAPDVERLITFPIEQACSNIPQLKEIRSFSRFGLSLVTIVFTEDADVYWARQQVAERLQQVQSDIPAGIGSPALAPVTTGLGEVYQYVVKARPGFEQRYNAMRLRTIQDWIVRRQLLGVKGVADVSSFGGYLKQYEVAVNTGKLQAYGVTIKDVFDALASNNENTGGAYIEKGPTVLYIRSEGLVGNEQDIGNIVVRSTQEGLPLLIRDVATVRIGSATRYGAMCYNDQGEVAGAVVMMLKGANSGAVIASIKERISQIQKTLPEGVVIEPFLDRTKMVNNAIGTVEKNLLEGSLIVVFVLILFLGNIRSGLIVASVIPLSMLFAIILMNLFGVSGNLMSLGALDFGLIVDGAVIIVEAVMHRLSHASAFKKVSRLSAAEMNEEVRSSASRMMNSAVFGQIIILIVYLPIFSLQGIEGKMFKPMAQTVAFALLGAFLLSLTYVPMMSALALDKRIKHSKNFSDRLMERLERRFLSVLQKALGLRKIVIAGTAALFVAAVAILLSLGGEFIPQLEEGDFAVDTRVLTGSNLTTTIHSTQQAAHLLLQRFPEVQKVVTKIGSGEIPTDPMPMEASDMMVILKDKSKWTSAHSFPELAEKMSAALKDVPGITTGFQFPVQMRFNELMTGARQDVVCKIFGENLDTLAAYAERVGTIAGQISGAKDIYVEQITGMPQILVNYDRNKIAQYGLNIGDLNNIVNTAFAGQRAGMVFEGERRFDLVVRLEDQQRASLQDVGSLMIPLPNGLQIPLNQLATVEVKDGPNQIQREDAKRRIIIGFNVRGRDVQSIVQELQQAIAQKLHFPAGYYITYGGAFENLQAAKKRLSIAVPVSLVLIFLMLYFAFKSVKHSLLIYTAIPLSSIGGVFALATRGMPFSISAGIGFIALFGVAVLNGIVLISEFNSLRRSGMSDLREVVLTGSKTRLRPVLMTAAVASLGFLPMALSNGAGAEVQRPLATVVIGGLISSTFLTLILLPILYLMFEKRNQHLKALQLPVTGLLFLLCLGSAQALGQKAVTLPVLLQKAAQQNLALKNEQLTVDYLAALKTSGWNIAAANLSGEFGHVNSAYTDYKLGFSQTFSFPTLYRRQQLLLHKQWTAGLLQQQLKTAQLQRDVALLYNDMLILSQKIKLLRSADSLYKAFAEKATLRFGKGAANVLEHSTAQNQQGQIHQQLQQAEADFAVLQARLKWLINEDTLYVPDEEDLRLPLHTTMGGEAVHPAVAYQMQQRAIATEHTRVLKAQLLPEVLVGYYNQSFRGYQQVGTVERFYTLNDRFSSFAGGISVPLFSRAQHSRIRAAKVSEQIAGNNIEKEQKELETNLQQQNILYTTAANSVRFFEQTALGHALAIRQAAELRLQEGEIDFLEYVLLVNQSFQTQNDYLDALHRMNQAALQINFLNNKQ